MEIGFGILCLSPNDFWNMSLYEFYSALDGFKEYNTDQSKTPLTEGELKDMMERYPD